MKNKIITIGREFGSGGRELGQRLAESLGIAYYDKEIITEIAKRTELSERYVKSIVERKPVFTYPIHSGRSFMSLNTSYVVQSSAVYAEQCKLLKELAEKSDCVIVGRCADHVLKEYDPFRIFVYADMENKIARCKRREEKNAEKSDKEIKKLIKSIDKHRAQYYNFYTGEKWGDRLNYDIFVNTTNADIAEIAPHIAKMI